MAEYQVVFVAVEGLSETDIDPTYRLAANDRKAAEDEARRLPRPEGANFIKLIRDGQYEAPKLGFAL
jgi:hypothetical protein